MLLQSYQILIVASHARSCAAERRYAVFFGHTLKAVDIPDHYLPPLLNMIPSLALLVVVIPSIANESRAMGRAHFPHMWIGSTHKHSRPIQPVATDNLFLHTKV